MEEKRKRDKSNLTDEKKRSLIQEVDKYPCLYNRGDEDYMDRKKKTVIWKSIESLLSISSKQSITF